MTTIIIYDIPQIIYDKYYQLIVLLYLYVCKYTVSMATKPELFTNSFFPTLKF